VEQLTYLQAIVIGLVQGVTELFPISSLGHSVLLPAWIGGSWQNLVTEESSSESPYLAFIVGLHVATALALLQLYWRDWVGIVRGFFTSIAHRSIQTVHERMAWMIVIATIPVGIVGLVAEHALRVLFATPLAAAIFLTVNGLILLLGERLRRRAERRPADRPADPGVEAGDAPTVDVTIASQLTLPDSVLIGSSQILALLAGISRSGVTMVTGLLRGLSHEEAIRFAFLLATPVIFAAGVYKIPDLTGPLGNGVRGQILVGSLAAFVAAYFAARFMVRWFRTRTLTPFAIYCLVVGGASIIRFA
jgi:undecaprenyl-diphosphatase